VLGVDAFMSQAVRDAGRNGVSADVDVLVAVIAGVRMETDALVPDGRRGDIG